jgi:hypothetical protein
MTDREKVELNNRIFHGDRGPGKELLLWINECRVDGWKPALEKHELGDLIMLVGALTSPVGRLQVARECAEQMTNDQLHAALKDLVTAEVRIEGILMDRKSKGLML